MAAINAVSGIDRLNRIYDPDMVMRPKRAQANGTGQADAAAEERRILAQEQALRASVPGGKAHTTYTYSTGPDGRMYISGADVSIIAPEDELRAATGSAGRPAGTVAEFGPAVANEPQARGGADAEELSPEAQKEVAKLEQTQREVIAHEAAHMAAGGQFAGSASYTYTTGPDGKQYITGGEVPISTPATSDPRQALQNAQQVLSAATAPASPSGPDMAVAANAARMAAQARIDMASGKGESEGSDSAGGEPNVHTESQIKNAYAATKSPKGLWTKAHGFEPEDWERMTMAQAEQDRFELAA